MKGSSSGLLAWNRIHLWMRSNSGQCHTSEASRVLCSSPWFRGRKAWAGWDISTLTHLSDAYNQWSKRASQLWMGTYWVQGYLQVYPGECSWLEVRERGKKRQQITQFCCYLNVALWRLVVQNSCSNHPSTNLEWDPDSGECHFDWQSLSPHVGHSGNSALSRRWSIWAGTITANSIRIPLRRSNDIVYQLIWCWGFLFTFQIIPVCWSSSQGILWGQFCHHSSVLKPLSPWLRHDDIPMSVFQVKYAGDPVLGHNCLRWWSNLNDL